MTSKHIDLEMGRFVSICDCVRLLVTGVGFAFFCVTPPQAASQAAAPTVRLIEDMRLDGTKESFSVVFAVAVGPGNKLAVWFPQEYSIRLFAGNGKPIGSVGGQGAGPGEFTNSLQGLRWISDSVWVNDVLRSRETVVSQEGRVIRTTSLPAARPDTSLGPLGEFVAHMKAADGALVGTAAFRGPPSPPGRPRVVGARAVLKVTKDTIVKLLAKMPVTDSRWDAPFAYVPQIAYSPVGTMFAYAQVDQLVPSGGTITVSAFRMNGDTAFMKSLPYEGVLMSRRVVDSMANARRIRDADGRVVSPPPINSARMPPVFVPLRQIMVGSDGRLWVLIRAAASSTAIALNSRGVPAASFKMPESSRLLAATATHIWIREEDADGVHSIVRYRFGS